MLLEFIIGSLMWWKCCYYRVPSSLCFEPKYRLFVIVI